MEASMRIRRDVMKYRFTKVPQGEAVLYAAGQREVSTYLVE
jgi:hypothetical protein